MNSNLQITESEVFSNLINKIEQTKTHLNQIYTHTLTTDSVKNIQYLEKLNEISSIIHNLNAISEDLYNEYILGLPENTLSNEEKEKQIQIAHNKKIYSTFAPYMLYMGIMLQNTTRQ